MSQTTIEVQSSLGYPPAHTFLPSNGLSAARFQPARQVPPAPEARRILLVQDDSAMSRFLRREFRHMHYAVDICHNAEAARDRLQTQTYQLILLDLERETAAADFLRLICAAEGGHSPILMLTAQSRTEDTILALDLGADDCLTKPFSFQEMQARIRSLLRRGSRLSGPQRSATSALVLRREQHLAVRGERRIELTQREFAILDYLMARAGTTVTRADLLREVWQTSDDPKTNIVDVYMKYLRDKLDQEDEPKLIRTVRGIGYVLDQN